MKGYLQGLLFAGAVACAYYFIDVRFFNLDILKSIRFSFFTSFNSRSFDENIILYNTGTLPDTAVIEKVKFLLTLNPKVIGINSCDLESCKAFAEAFAAKPDVVIASCENEGPVQLSSIINDGNTVTHFRTSPDGFEIKIAGLKKGTSSGKEIEMINFRPDGYYRSELSDPLIPEYPEDAIFLVGYMGDILSSDALYIGSQPMTLQDIALGEDGPNDMYYFKSTRITPLNRSFGKENISPDAYDIEIAANIISTIHDDDFISEVPLWLRVCIMLVVCLVNVGIIMWIKTRWILLNAAIYIFTFFFLIMAAGLTIVYLFSDNIYLNLDGLEILLLIASVYTVFSVSSEKRKHVESA